MPTVVRAFIERGKAAVATVRRWDAENGLATAPTDPDDAMIEAGEEAISAAHIYGGRVYASNIQKAMIDAAPSPPGSAKEDKE